jgi:transposase
LREQGYTYDAIAKHFKVGTSTVCRDIFAAMEANRNSTSKHALAAPSGRARAEIIC